MAERANVSQLNASLFAVLPALKPWANMVPPPPARTEPKVPPVGLRGGGSRDESGAV